MNRQDFYVRGREQWYCVSIRVTLLWLLQWYRVFRRVLYWCVCYSDIEYWEQFYIAVIVTVISSIEKSYIAVIVTVISSVEKSYIAVIVAVVYFHVPDQLCNIWYCRVFILWYGSSFSPVRWRSFSIRIGSRQNDTRRTEKLSILFWVMYLLSVTYFSFCSGYCICCPLLAKSRCYMPACVFYPCLVSVSPES